MNTEFYRNRLRKIRARNEVNLQIRRGENTLEAQPMRIEMAGPGSSRLQSDAARSATQPVLIMGEFDMDIQEDDRITHENKLIKVVFIQLDRRFGTIAEAFIEQ